jgi:hypothetical protein
LASIERINRDQIKKQQHAVHEPESQNKLVEIWMNCLPLEFGDQKGEQGEQRK